MPLADDEFGTIRNGVFFGKDGYLFLVDGQHNVLEYASGSLAPLAESIENFRLNIHERALVAGSATYLHIVTPDKQSVLRDEFCRGDVKSLGKIYLERCPSVTEHILFPDRALAAHVGPVFYKTDTHLNEMGTIVVASKLMETIGLAPMPDSQQELCELPVDKLTKQGDLGSRFDPPFTEDALFFPRTWIDKKYFNGVGTGNNGIVEIYFNRTPKFAKRVALFGDSFGRDLAPWLSYFFSEVVFMRTPFFYPEIFSQIAPDYVFTQNAERYLSWCYRDELRESFFLTPGLKGATYNPDPDFCEAFSAVLSYGRPPYEKFMASLDRSLALRRQQVS